jgi:hypothetical protein
MSATLLSDLFANTSVEKIAGLALGLLFAAFFWIASLRLRGGRRPYLRPMAAFDLLREAVSLAAESNRPIHVSAGAGTLGDVGTAETVAGLTIVEALAQPAATSAAPILITTASPVVVPIAQGMLQGAYQKAGYPRAYDPAQVRFLGPSRVAYAAGAAGLVRQVRAATSVLVGDFGDEYLLLGEPAARDGITLVAGAGDARVLPFVFATASHPLLGEEIFAGGAYLTGRRAHLASLMAQDYSRLLIIALVLGGVLLKSLNPG